MGRVSGDTSKAPRSSSTVDHPPPCSVHPWQGRRNSRRRPSARLMRPTTSGVQPEAAGLHRVPTSRSLQQQWEPAAAAFERGLQRLARLLSPCSGGGRQRCGELRRPWHHACAPPPKPGLAAGLRLCMRAAASWCRRSGSAGKKQHTSQRIVGRGGELCAVATFNTPNRGPTLLALNRTLPTHLRNAL